MTIVNKNASDFDLVFERIVFIRPQHITVKKNSIMVFGFLIQAWRKQIILLKPLCFSIATASLLTGCQTGPTIYPGSLDHIENRKMTLAQGAKAVSEGDHGALYKLVERYRRGKTHSKNINKYIDYHYMRDTSELVLMQFYENALNNGKRGEARAYLSEALRISPKNKKLQALFAQLNDRMSGEADKFIYFSKLSPTSDSASIYNSLFLRRARYHLGYHAKTIQSLDDFSDNDSALLRSRFFELVENKKTLTVSRSERFSTFVKNFNKRFGFKLVVHENLRGLFNKKLIRRSKRISPLDLLVQTAEVVKGNFLLGTNTIYMFAGQEIPDDLGKKKSAAYIKSENGEVNSLISALRAYGFGPQIVQVDASNKLIWLQCTYGEYVQAVMVASAVDFPKAEILLDVDIVEVQTTLVDQIGLRIPQLIDFNVGDPSFARYFLGTEEGYETVTNISSTGSIVLDNLLNKRTANVIRAVIRDPGIQLAAESSNFHVKLASKPTLRLRDKERARIKVGDRIPSFTTTSSSSGFVSETVTYTDSGLTLDVDAQIASNSEVVIGLSLESKNFVRDVKSQSGASAPQFSQRLASTKLSVQDGNTVYIGGLFSSDKRNERSGVPGVGKTVFSFFGGMKRDKETVIELMVFITPTIVRPRTAPARHFLGGFRAPNNQSVSALNSTSVSTQPKPPPREAGSSTLSGTSGRRGG